METYQAYGGINGIPPYVDLAVGAGGCVLALRVVFHGFRIEAFAAGEVERGLVTSLLWLPCLVEKLP